MFQQVNHPFTDIYACCLQHPIKLYRMEVLSAVSSSLQNKDDERPFVTGLISRSARLSKLFDNLAENAIRPLTLSRMDFLFCGNHEASKNTAVICSPFATYKTQDVDPREWLNDVMSRLPYYLEKSYRRNVRELLPDVWKLEKSNSSPIGV